MQVCQTLIMRLWVRKLYTTEERHTQSKRGWREDRRELVSTLQEADKWRRSERYKIHDHRQLSCSSKNNAFTSESYPATLACNVYVDLPHWFILLLTIDIERLIFAECATHFCVKFLTDAEKKGCKFRLFYAPFQLFFFVGHVFLWKARGLIENAF